MAQVPVCPACPAPRAATVVWLKESESIADIAEREGYVRVEPPPPTSPLATFVMREGGWERVPHPAVDTSTATITTRLEEYLAPGTTSFTVPEQLILEDSNDEHILFSTFTSPAIHLYNHTGKLVQTRERPVKGRTFRFAPDGGIFSLCVDDDHNLRAIFHESETATQRWAVLATDAYYAIDFLQVLDNTTLILMRIEGMYEVWRDGKYVHTIPTRAGQCITPIRSAIGHVLHEHHFGVFGSLVVNEDQLAGVEMEISLPRQSFTVDIGGAELKGTAIGVTSDGSLISCQRTKPHKPALVRVTRDATITLANRLGERRKNAFVDGADRVLVHHDNTVLIFKLA